MTRFPIVGYALLPQFGPSGYRGVDRNPFEPEVLDDELSDRPGPSGQAYTLYPPGWRRDAYHLYEDGLTVAGLGDIYLIRTLETARRLEALVSSHVDAHEIVRCAIWPIADADAEDDANLHGFLGFDVAYLGGDHYSAILNGLIINPNPDLVRDYGGHLNDARLFATTRHIPSFVRRFRELVPSEASSTFYVHSLVAP